jgi:hypothetical protein
VFTKLVVSNCSPEIAVPITVKIPEPITAPMPSAVSDQGPRVFFRECSGSAESLISLSIDLRASSWLGSALLLVLGVSEIKQCWKSRGPGNRRNPEIDWAQDGP